MKVSNLMYLRGLLAAHPGDGRIEVSASILSGLIGETENAERVAANRELEANHFRACMETLSGWLLEGSIGESAVRPEFIACMAAEIRANSHKGDWKAWQPTPEEIASQISVKARKLYAVLLSGDLPLVREFSADLANLAMKAAALYGESLGSVFLPTIAAQSLAMLDCTVVDYDSESMAAAVNLGKEPSAEDACAFLKLADLAEIESEFGKSTFSVGDRWCQRFCNSASYAAAKCVHGRNLYRLGKPESGQPDGECHECFEIISEQKRGFYYPPLAAVRVALAKAEQILSTDPQTEHDRTTKQEVCSHGVNVRVDRCATCSFDAVTSKSRAPVVGRAIYEDGSVQIIRRPLQAGSRPCASCNVLTVNTDSEGNALCKACAAAIASLVTPLPASPETTNTESAQG